MAIVYTDDPKNIDFNKVTDFINSSATGKNAEFNKVIKAFLNSTYSVYALDGEEIVGVGRALSDDIEWTLITGLTVSEERRDEITGNILGKFLERFKGHEIFAYTESSYYKYFEDSGFFRSKNSFTFSGYEEGEDLTGLDESSFLPLGYKFENEYGKVPEGFPVHEKSNINEASVNISYSSSFEGIDINDVNELLSNAFGGKKRDVNITKKAFEGSRYVQFATDRGKLIGCARAESDGVSQGFILNVAVDPSYQGHHLGREVVSRLSAQMEGENIFLNTHPGSVGFYNRKGFRRNKNAFLYPAHPDMPPEVKRGFFLPGGYRFEDEY